MKLKILKLTSGDLLSLVFIVAMVAGGVTLATKLSTPSTIGATVIDANLNAVIAQENSNAPKKVQNISRSKFLGSTIMIFVFMSMIATIVWYKKYEFVETHKKENTLDGEDVLLAAIKNKQIHLAQKSKPKYKIDVKEYREKVKKRHSL